MKPKSSIILVVILLIFAGLYSMAFTVDETEQVVITRIGKIDRIYDTSGLKFKIPFLEEATFYPKNLLQWDGEKGQIPTLEKTYIWVDTFARWKIVNAENFFKSVRTVASAKNRLDEIIDPAIRNLLTSNKLIEAVRSSDRELDTFEIGLEDITKGDRPSYDVTIGRDKITKMILKQAQPKLVQFGIELVDVKIKRINYVEEVRNTVYGRMIAERNQIAEKFRSEGEGEARKIMGEKERDLKEIQSKAYRRSQEIKGSADAQVTKIFAEAYGRDPEFYQYTQTLKIYAKALAEKSSAVLSTDSEFLKYIKGPGKN